MTEEEKHRFETAWKECKDSENENRETNHFLVDGYYFERISIKSIVLTPINLYYNRISDEILDRVLEEMI